MNIDFPQNLQRHHHTDEHDQLVLILFGSYHWMNMPLNSSFILLAFKGARFWISTRKNFLTKV